MQMLGMEPRLVPVDVSLQLDPRPARPDPLYFEMND